MSQTGPLAGGHRVWVIFDPEFGECLAELPADESIWIAGSSSNAAVAKRLWKERPSADITTFDHGTETSPEEEFLSLIGTIDLHHGEYSAQPPYSEVEVVGCPLASSIEGALEEINFRVVSQTADGFVARKQVQISS